MPRNLSTSFLAQAIDGTDGTPPLIFAEIRHDWLESSIFVVSDDAIVDGEAALYRWNNEYWRSLPFSMEIISDDEGPPRATVDLPAVDNEIADIIQELDGAPELYVYLVSGAEFDRSSHPYQQIGDPYVQIEITHLRLQNVRHDGLFLSADITSWDYTQEPWPSKNASEARLPGLYR